jgi:hypothetical protein
LVTHRGKIGRDRVHSEPEPLGCVWVNGERRRPASSVGPAGQPVDTGTLDGSPHKGRACIASLDRSRLRARTISCINGSTCNGNEEIDRLSGQARFQQDR